MDVNDPAQALIRYEAELVAATSAAEACFVAVNRLGAVMPYRLAVLLHPDPLRGARVGAVSHLSEVDDNAPFAQWLGRLVKLCGQQPVTVLTQATAPADLAGDWAEWLPEQAVLCRLASPSGAELGWILAAFDDELDERGVTLLQLACRQVGLVLAAWRGRGWKLNLRAKALRRKWVPFAALAVVVLVLLIPVRLSTLAPAEVTPVKPASIAAPVDGVLAKFNVAPNTMVKAGDVVATIDDTVMRNRYAMSQKGLEVARAEYARAGSKSFADDQSRSELLTLKARIDERMADVAYTEELLGRIQLRSPVDGLVIYSSPDEWVGRPLVTGERIATVANPARAALTLHLPADDAIDVEVGAAVQFYQNVSPLDSLSAAVTEVGYETQTTVDAGLAYVLRAEFPAGTQPPRLGLRGTGKIYGHYVPLGYYLLRRPFGSMRRVLGL
jgi:multidrug resistance efflux pump